MSHEQPHLGSDEQSPPSESHKEDIERIERLGFLDANGKAQIILVLLGEQPAADIFLYPHDDPPEKIAQVLGAAGLAVTQGRHTDAKGREISLVFIARTPETADKLQRASPPQGPRTEHEAYARLMGFPQTAIDAFLNRTPRLSPEESDALRDPDVIFQMIFSKEHWKEELEFLRKRSRLIKRYAPRLYEEIVKR